MAQILPTILIALPLSGATLGPAPAQLAWAQQGPARQEPARQQSARLAILADRVLTIASGEVSPGVVLIEDGVIRSVQPLGRIPGGYRVVDARGHTVMPGLVDVHTHHGLRDPPLTPETTEMTESSEPFTPQVRVHDSIDVTSPAFAKLRSLGTTTVAVLPGSSNLISGLGLVLKTRDGSLDEMLATPVPILKMALGMNPKSAHGGRGRSPRTRMGSAAMLRAKFGEARAYDRRRNESPDSAVDLELEPLRQALAGDIPVNIHAARADDILTALRLIEEFGLRGSVHHAYEGYLVADEIARAGVPVALGPKLDGWLRGTSPERPIDVAGRMMQAGVEVTILTDGYVPDLFLQALYAARLGLSEARVLQAVTLNAARLLGLDDRVGSLEPGKEADLVVLDGDPLAPGTTVVMTFIEGEMVFDARARRAAAARFPFPAAKER